MIAALNPITAAAGPDPVLALIEAHQDAYAAWDQASHAWNHMDPQDPGYEAAEAAAEEPGRREREAMLTLLAGRPTTVAGLWALTAYLPEAVRRVNPAPETEAQAALDALRESAQQLGLAPAAAEAHDDRLEEWTILDTCLVSLVRELVAIEAEQTAILKAGDYADAFDAPDWVRLEGHRESILGRVIAIRAHTMEGLKAKASLTGLGSVKHSQEAMERLAHSLAADVAGIDAPPSAEAPDAALLALGLPFLAAWRDEGAADPVSTGERREVPPGVPTFDEAHARCSALADRIAALPATTPEGLGVKALAFACFSGSLGSPASPMPEPDASSTASDDALLWQIQAGAARILAGDASAAAPSADDAAALALVDAIEREWAAFIDLERQGGDDDSAEASARHAAAMDRRSALLDAAERLSGRSRDVRHAKALALAWVIAVDLWTEEQPREQYGTDGRLALDLMDSLGGGAPPTTADASRAAAAAPPAVDLSGCSLPQLARLYESLRGVYDHLSAASQRSCFRVGPMLTPAGAILDEETDRIGGMLSDCADAVAARTPATDRDWDEALLVRVSHAMAANGCISDRTLMRDLVRSWGENGHIVPEVGR